MQNLKQYIKTKFGTCYEAAKTVGARDSQLARLCDKDAQIDKEGQVWIKSKTKLVIKNERKR